MVARVTRATSTIAQLGDRCKQPWAATGFWYSRARSLIMCASAFGRTVAILGAFRRVAIELYQHGVIDLGTIRALDGFQVCPVPVAGQLDAVGEPYPQDHARAHLMPQTVF
ncbi:hypothetical protein D3227_33975 [Mesorhizobium waimense]|uniref:Uncharacterized protein n=1 Tax=Mesorhizobium waimense TaxID=1300307 RepID=A0A3A5K876_9HYPH|nr:hypothetical protein D3227_33975 [Mesorhizobium waimense]